MTELSLADTSGVLRQPTVNLRRNSSGLGWSHLYLSTQEEQPYRAEFDATATHMLVLHLNGPVTVSRGRGRAAQTRRVPTGGLFLHPAGRRLAVELGGRLDTVHAYLTERALQDANNGSPVELSEELGTADPLIEQLLLALEGLVQQWEPSARTYADHLTGMLAAQLARRHRANRAEPTPSRISSGLSSRQLSAVRDLMEERLADPLPIADLAAAASLSVSQFARQFKASTGESPHQFLLRLRLEQACRLLRTGTTAIGEVAVDCGFSHQEHLTRVMRAKLDTTPGAVRRPG
ncbi:MULTISPECIES: AraC family transcriptional regulator [unclassified Streptomyces]|uniref:AraC family transcriptional regulator n=1 Tax=Streptomyces sp. NBC_00119 TaxID=2975659 RepID=A0AAU1ULI0_9ACTN|nr:MULTISPECIES: AraC family transcriptional regulator [unclassified Streptomyces]MCX4649548.1 AraC family transcriptional regulator [Streptomyces sp. NBC_01446]MCX5321254.1 AraC family transcriptional regulator [Streptomyces sp. NBC_00120]